MGRDRRNDGRVAKVIRWMTSALLALLVGAACGADPGPRTAPQVDAAIESLTAAYDARDPFARARFYTAGGTLDLTEWGGGVATSPAEIVDSIRALHLGIEF